jgi:hypothetical protein
MKIWSPDLSAMQIPPMCCRVYGEVCTPGPGPQKTEETADEKNPAQGESTVRVE